MNRIAKILSVLMSIALVFTIFSPLQGKAQELNNIEGYDEEGLSKLLDFVKSAIEVDEFGEAKVNLEKIEKKFGYIPQEYIDFNNSQKNINTCTSVAPLNTSIDSRNMTYATAEPSYNTCVLNEFKSTWKDITGVASLTAAVEALAAGKELKAAQHLFKAGAKGGIHGIVLSLGWIQIKCIGK